jgi:hypothetical protein
VQNFVRRQALVVTWSKVTPVFSPTPAQAIERDPARIAWTKSHAFRISDHGSSGGRC